MLQCACQPKPLGADAGTTASPTPPTLPWYDRHPALGATVAIAGPFLVGGIMLLVASAVSSGGRRRRRA